jgi:hypothetical protein
MVAVISKFDFDHSLSMHLLDQGETSLRDRFALGRNGAQRTNRNLSGESRKSGTHATPPVSRLRSSATAVPNSRRTRSQRASVMRVNSRSQPSAITVRRSAGRRRRVTFLGCYAPTPVWAFKAPIVKWPRVHSNLLRFVAIRASGTVSERPLLTAQGPRPRAGCSWRARSRSRSETVRIQCQRRAGNPPRGGLPAELSISLTRRRVARATRPQLLRSPGRHRRTSLRGLSLPQCTHRVPWHACSRQRRTHRRRPSRSSRNRQPYHCVTTSESA